MRLIGKVQGCVVVILINTGSTYNFMDHSIVKKALIKVKKTLWTKVANGATLGNERKCTKVKLHMQGNLYSTKFYLFTLGDVILFWESNG